MASSSAKRTILRRGLASTSSPSQSGSPNGTGKRVTTSPGLSCFIITTPGHHKVELPPPSARALKCIFIIMGFEGGYVNDPLDPGGETNYGISKRAYPH